MENVSWTEWLQRAQRGDEAAFATFFEIARAPLGALASEWWMVRNSNRVVADTRMADFDWRQMAERPTCFVARVEPNSAKLEGRWLGTSKVACIGSAAAGIRADQRNAPVWSNIAAIR
jgi:hypothetical protein